MSRISVVHRIQRLSGALLVAACALVSATGAAAESAESRVWSARVDTTLAPITGTHARIVAVRADTTLAPIRAAQARVVAVRADTTLAAVRAAQARIVAVRTDTTVAPISAGFGRMFPLFVDTSAFAAQLRVDVLGPARIRPDRRVAFDLVIQNDGNDDALAVPLWVSGIPVNAVVQPAFALTPVPSDGGEPDWSQVPLGFTSPAGRYVVLVLPRIRPGVLTRRLYLSVPAADSAFQLRASLTPPWLDEATFKNCLLNAGVIQNPNCMGARLSAIESFMLGTPGIEAVNGIGVWAKIAWQCEGATSLPNALVKAELALDYMNRPVDGTGSVPPTCGETLRPRWQDVLAVRIVTSFDPNEKIGARGVGTQQTISGRNFLPYTIRFENKDTAPVPAQDVVIIDRLDSAMNLDSLQLNRITFGPHSIDPPAGIVNGVWTKDLRPYGTNLLVRVVTDLDVATRVLRWTFTSIDPDHPNDPPPDSMGFLPPNDATGRGEGSVNFNVVLRSSVSPDSLPNRASIYFDSNDPIEAGWVNMLDHTPPASRVQPVPAKLDSVPFLVRWEITDGSTDLRDYTVFVAEDQGQFDRWQHDVIGTSAVFAPRAGHYYAFYSIARDQCGNIEAAPATPDALTLPPADAGDMAAWLALEGARPNPAFDDIHAWFTLPAAGPATLELIDVAGRRVRRRDVGNLGPGRHVVSLAASRLPPGIYFLRLTRGDRTLTARLALIR